MVRLAGLICVKQNVDSDKNDVGQNMRVQILYLIDILVTFIIDRKKLTYVFFELGVLLRHLVELAFEAAELVLLLKAAFESALAVLEESSLLFGKVGGGDTLLDLGELTLGRVLRGVAAFVSIGEVRHAVKVVLFLVLEIRGGRFLVRGGGHRMDGGLTALGIFLPITGILLGAFPGRLESLAGSSILGTVVLPADVASLGPHYSTVLLRHTSGGNGRRLLNGHVQIVGAGETAELTSERRIAGLCGPLDLRSKLVQLRCVDGFVPVLLGGGVNLLKGALGADLGEDLLQDKVVRSGRSGVLRHVLKGIQNLRSANALHRSDRHRTLDLRHH